MDALEISINKLKNTPSNAKFADNIDDIYYNDKDKLYLDDEDKLYLDIDLYSEIIIVLLIEIIKTKETKETKFSFTMTEEFKEAFKNKNNDIELLKVLFIDKVNKKYYKNINILKVLGEYHSKIIEFKGFKLANVSTSGGKKAVVKYTVKDLQAIAIENKIKITKKVEGKTVRLNKQGMIAKLKRYKLI